MKVNRRAGTCIYCHNRVEALAGVTWSAGKSRGRWKKWNVAHTACKEAQGPEVIEARFSDGYGGYSSMKVNARGRCEDAPCCGCCD